MSITRFVSPLDPTVTLEGAVDVVRNRLFLESDQNNYVRFDRFVRWASVFFNYNQNVHSDLYRNSLSNHFREYVIAHEDELQLDALDYFTLFLSNVDTHNATVPVFRRYGSAVSPSVLEISSDEYSDWNNYYRAVINTVKIANKKLNQTNLQAYPISLRSVFDYLNIYDSARRIMLKVMFNFSCIETSRGSYITPAMYLSSYASNTNVQLKEIDFSLSIVRNIPEHLKPYEKFSKLLNYTADPMKYVGVDCYREPDEPALTTTLFGVELELSTDYDVMDVVSAFGTPFAICKSDASVNGSKTHSYEVVTVPASLRIQRAMWTKFFRTIDESKFDTSTKTNNGMHVHVGRDAFRRSNGDTNNNHLIRFSYFFNNPANRWFIVAMSERTADNISGYCNFVNLLDYKTKGKTIANVVKNGNRGKMFAVNHSKAHTIEVRIFKGIVSYSSVIKNLELVDAVLNYTADCSLQECNAMGLAKWISSLPKSRYRALRVYLERELGLSTIFEICSVTEYNILPNGGTIDKAMANTVAAGLSENAKRYLRAYDARWTHLKCNPNISTNGTSVMKKYDAELLSMYPSQ